VSVSFPHTRSQRYRYRLTLAAFLLDRSSEFIKLIALSANDECEKDKKKTIAPEHVISAMDVSEIGRVDTIRSFRSEHIAVDIILDDWDGTVQGGLDSNMGC
jgi:hypothetical protein